MKRRPPKFRTHAWRTNLHGYDYMLLVQVACPPPRIAVAVQFLNRRAYSMETCEFDSTGNGYITDLECPIRDYHPKDKWNYRLDITIRGFVPSVECNRLPTSKSLWDFGPLKHQFTSLGELAALPDDLKEEIELFSRNRLRDWGLDPDTLEYDETKDWSFWRTPLWGGPRTSTGDSTD